MLAPVAVICREHIPVVVPWDCIRDLGRISIRVHQPNRRDVLLRALVQQRVVLERVHDHDQIRHHRPPLQQMPLEALDRLVLVVHDLELLLAQDHVAVRDGAGDPLGEQVAGAGQLGGARNHLHLALAVADKQQQAAEVGDLLDDLGGAAQRGGRLLERDDVDVGAHAVDVALHGRVPQAAVVAHVALRGHEQLERHVRGPRRVAQQRRRGEACVHGAAEPARRLGEPLRDLVREHGALVELDLAPAVPARERRDGGVPPERLVRGGLVAVGGIVAVAWGGGGAGGVWGRGLGGGCGQVEGLAVVCGQRAAGLGG